MIGVITYTSRFPVDFYIARGKDCNHVDTKIVTIFNDEDYKKLIEVCTEEKLAFKVSTNLCTNLPLICVNTGGWEIY